MKGDRAESDSQLVKQMLYTLEKKINEESVYRITNEED